jgi:hypothetical protein
MRIDPTQFAPGMEIREYDPARDSHAVRERLMASSRISLSRTRIAAEVSADPFCTKLKHALDRRVPDYSNSR